MRVLVLEPSARDEHAGVGQRLDDRLVGVALLAVVRDDALAGEARRLLGEGAILVDRIGDRGVDAARGQRARIRRPDVEVLAPVPRRGVHEAGAGVVGDVIAIEQRDDELIALAAKRMMQRHAGQHRRRHVRDLVVGHNLGLLENLAREILRQDVQIAEFRPVVRRRIGDFVEPY